MAAAGALAVLPLFLARLSLAYFPAMVGHAVDAVVILYLLARLRELDRPRVVVTLAALIALALLTYTQSLLNFAVLLPLFLVVLLARDRVGGDAAMRDRASWSRARWAPCSRWSSSTAGTCRRSSTCSGAFPMPEERILLEKPSTPVPAEELAPQEPDDPLRRAPPSIPGAACARPPGACTCSTGSSRRS